MKHTWALVAILVAGILSTAALWIYINVQRQQRLDQIQASRVESCQHTYQAFLEVFRPFFPSPSERTPRQNEQWARLSSIVNRLRANCVEQTKAKEGG